MRVAVMTEGDDYKQQVAANHTMLAYNKAMEALLGGMDAHSPEELLKAWPHTVRTVEPNA